MYVLRTFCIHMSVKFVTEWSNMQYSISHLLRLRLQKFKFPLYIDSFMLWISWLHWGLTFSERYFKCSPNGWCCIFCLFDFFLFFNIDEFYLRMNSHVNDLKTVSKLILICDCLLLMHFYNSVHSVVDIVVVYLFIFLCTENRVYFIWLGR